MSSQFSLARTICVAAIAGLVVVPVTASSQQSTSTRRAGAAPPTRRPVKVNQARAESLYVSTDPADHPQRNFERDIAAKARTDSIYAARSRGVMDFAKVTYRSRAGDMDVPAYLFAPLQKRGTHGHAAMVWVHGGVHGNWDTLYFPFIKEAVERGYVIVSPEYRGSTGYGEK